VEPSVIKVNIDQCSSISKFVIEPNR